jgi:hypothetical protein
MRPLLGLILFLMPLRHLSRITTIFNRMANFYEGLQRRIRPRAPSNSTREKSQKTVRQTPLPSMSLSRPRPRSTTNSKKTTRPYTQRHSPANRVPHVIQKMRSQQLGFFDNSYSSEPKIFRRNIEKMGVVRILAATLIASRFASGRRKERWWRGKRT